MASAYWMRVGNEVRGPYTPGQILQATLLEKVSKDTLISADRVTWRAVADEWGTLVAAPAGDPPPRVAPPRPAPRPAAAEAWLAARPRTRPKTAAARGDVPARRRAVPKAFAPAPPRVVPPTALLLGAAFGMLALLVGGIVLASGAAGPASPSRARDVPVAAGSDVRDARDGGATPSAGEPLLRRAGASVAVLRDGRASVTGFLVERGVLVTSARGVRSMIPAMASVTFPSTGRAEHAVARLLALDEERDIAVLAVGGEGPGLALSSASRPDPGARIFVIGNASTGAGPVVEHGLASGVAGAEVVIGSAAFLEVRTRLYEGRGGEAVFAADGSLVGLVSGRASHRPGVSLVVPARHLEAALREARERTADTIARLNEAHLAHALFLQLDRGGVAYCGALEGYIAGLRRAMTRGAHTLEDARRYLPNLRAELGRLEATVGPRLTACARLLDASPCSDASVRADLAALRDSVEALRTDASAGDGLDVGDSLTRSVRSVSAFRRVRDGVRDRLGGADADD